MKIGIIGAMKAEIDRVLEKTEVSNTFENRVCRIAEGVFATRSVCVSRSGIGKVNAAMCAQTMIMNFRPDIVINIGVAGALAEGLSIGDAVIADFAVQHDIDTTGFGDPKGLVPGLDLVRMPCDTAMRDAFLKAAAQLGMHAVTSGIATGDQFIAGYEHKSALGGEFACAACDMEGGAIAQVCMANGTPYAAYRTISDTLRGSETEFSLNLKISADASIRLLETTLRML